MNLRNNIWILLTFILFSTGTNGQVYIGDGVSISEGTNLTIVDQEVILSTNEIKGEGKIIIHHHQTQNITVLNNFKSKKKFQISANKIKIEGRYAQKFAAYHLPPLTEEIIASKTEEKLNQDLPIRYINTEGRVYDLKDEKEENPILSSTPKDVSDGIIVSQRDQRLFADLQLDYIIPIYSVLLKNERFSDCAELYKFECLTAILKPPIVEFTKLF